MCQNSLSLQCKPNLNESFFINNFLRPNSVNNATDSIFCSSGKARNVYIVDDFSNKDIDLNNDKNGDITHGEFVELIMKTKNPFLNIKKLAMPEDEDDWTSAALNKRLQTLYRKIRSGEKIDAVNLSMEQSIKFSDLKKQIGNGLTQENLHRYNNKIRNWLSYNRPGVLQNIKSIENIIKAGVSVYIAGGSKGDEYINLLNFAQGSIDVAGLDENGRIGRYSSDNSLIDKKDRGTYTISHQGQGFDINGDRKADFFPVKNIGFGYGQKVGRIAGSSFAAPMALAKDMKRS